MRYGGKQNGITLIGFVVILAILGFFAFLVMRLFPVYSEYYSVVSAMKGVQGEPGVANMSPEKVKDLLFRRLSHDGHDVVRAESGQRALEVQPRPPPVKVTRQNGYNLNVKYEVRRPLAYNLDFVASFDKTVELTRQGELD